MKKGGGTSGSKGGAAETGFQPVNPWECSEVAVKQAASPARSGLASDLFRHVSVLRGTYPTAGRERYHYVCDTPLGPAEIDLNVAVVMPEHVHAVFPILDDSELSNILHSIKSFSAKQVNRFLCTTGMVVDGRELRSRHQA